MASTTGIIGLDEKGMAEAPQAAIREDLGVAVRCVASVQSVLGSTAQGAHPYSQGAGTRW